MSGELYRETNITDNVKKGLLLFANKPKTVFPERPRGERIHFAGGRAAKIYGT